MIILRCCLLVLVNLLAVGQAWAHEMSMAELQLQELAPGEFQWQWSQAPKRPPGLVLTPVWPRQCAGQAGRLSCGPAGLRGELRLEGIGETYSAALVRVDWLRGGTRVYTLTGGDPSVQLYGSANDERGALEIVRAYLWLGFEHILTGWDHLAFVLALLFLIGFRRKLFWTITAFTLSHSVTLALTALGFLVLRPAPVEVCIAASILLVVLEACSERDTLSRRWPALVAFTFGLVHGLGFGGALEEVGLPRHAIPSALLAFNVGVECGNLLLLLAAALLWRALRQWKKVGAMRRPVLYAMGSISAYWTLSRVVGLLT